MALDSTWLSELIAQREPESDTLEFKRQLYSNEARKDFASDVVSFANAHGGLLVLGVEEDKEGRASRVSPLTGSQETEIQRMDAWLATQVFPRLRGYQWHPISIESGYVLVLQIPPQFSGPYQASFGAWKRFSIRSGRTTPEMDYQQLASAFGQRSRVMSDLRQWRKERIELLQSWIHGGKLEETTWAFLHVVPLAAFSDPPRIDLRIVQRNNVMFRGHRASTQYNSNGLLATLSPLHLRAHSEYLQFFRRGIIEHGWRPASTLGSTSRILSLKAMQIIEGSVAQTTEVLAGADLRGPLAVTLTILNVEGKPLHIINEDDDTQPFTEYGIHIDEVVLPDLDSFTDYRLWLPQLSHELFQAFGVEECPFFLADGRLNPGFMQLLRS